MPSAELADKVGSISWYHTIDLPDGLVTPGWFDVRPALAHVPLPSSLEGMRCLDVGTADGFWAFEMAKRGATSVVAVDLDDSAKSDYPELVEWEDEDATRALRAFGIVNEALGLPVERRSMSIYEISPELGTFDFVMLHSLLLHLRDPVRGLAAVRTVTDGELVVGDVVSYTLSRLSRRKPMAMLAGVDRGTWWTPNMAGLRRMVAAAGFAVSGSGGPYYVPFGPGHPGGKGSLRALKGPLSSRLAQWMIIRRGIPHAWVRAAPRRSATKKRWWAS